MNRGSITLPDWHELAKTYHYILRMDDAFELEYDSHSQTVTLAADGSDLCDTHYRCSKPITTRDQLQAFLFAFGMAP